MNHPALRIPIALAGEPGVPYGLEPLTFGVPFAEGAFPAGTALRCITADGRALPLQTAEVATWKPDLQTSVNGDLRRKLNAPTTRSILGD